MACTTLSLSGIDARCDTTIGGVKEVYITDHASVVPGSAVSGILSSLALATSGTKMKMFRFRKGQASMVSTATIDKTTGNNFITTVLSITFTKMDAAKRVQIQALIAGGACVIVKDNNGKYWFLGYDDVVDSASAEGNTGAAVTDANAYTIGLEDVSRELPFEVADTCITSTLIDGL